MASATFTFVAWLAMASAAMPKSELADWSQGATSWKQASLGDQEDLWSTLNACDPQVLRGSAPLTLLFGISQFWSDFRQQRAATNRSEQPYEVHVLGSAYPFEGRADWSLLASRRPKDVPKVRIVLVLGTPWQSDNVPVYLKRERDSTTLLQVSYAKAQLSEVTRDDNPEYGKYEGGLLHCSKQSDQIEKDKIFSKADLCRDHGNGLEVVCIEKYYQDAADELPSPDLVAMFSPGFPQIARRSWDEVLRKVLLANVPIMISDLRHSETLHSKRDGRWSFGVAPGEPWDVREDTDEDGMTFVTMQAYGARRLGSFRNPFPIINPPNQEGGYELEGPIVKNGVLQVFHGRHANAAPFQIPSKEQVLRQKQLVETLDADKYLGGAETADVIKKSFLIPTSTAYDIAMMKHYFPSYDDLARNSNSKMKELGSKGKEAKPWDFEDWVYIFSHTDLAEHVF